jgi:hypothetical protein
LTRVKRGACKNLPEDGTVTVKGIGAGVEADANITVVDDESHDAYAALIVNGVKMTTNPLRARVKDGDRVSVYVCAASSHGHKVTVAFQYGGDAAQPVMITRLSLGTFFEPPSPPPSPPPPLPPPPFPPPSTPDLGDIAVDQPRSCVHVPSSGGIKVKGLGPGVEVLANVSLDKPHLVATPPIITVNGENAKGSSAMVKQGDVIMLYVCGPWWGCAQVEIQLTRLGFRV